MNKNIISAVFAALFTMLLLTGCDKQTGDGALKVTTYDIISTTLSKVEVSFNVFISEDIQVSAAGICWSESKNPTLKDRKTDEGAVTGHHNSVITDFEANTTYYVRAYAIGNGRTVYGEEKTFNVEKSVSSVTCEAGRLEEIIKGQGATENNSLILSGTIDQRDFIFMRDGMPNIAYVDLSDVTIAEYGDYPANEIPDYAFYKLVVGEDGSREYFNKYSLETIKFPRNLKSIGAYAFYSCENIEGSLEFPESLTHIGDYAFNSCKKISGQLNLPPNLEYIGYGAFKYCTGLTGTLNNYG